MQPAIKKGTREVATAEPQSHTLNVWATRSLTLVPATNAISLSELRVHLLFACRSMQSRSTGRWRKRCFLCGAARRYLAICNSLLCCSFYFYHVRISVLLFTLCTDMFCLSKIMICPILHLIFLLFENESVTPRPGFPT